MRMMAGVDLLHVPYKGGGPAFQDVMGGRVEFTTLPIAESLANVQAKRVKALAQTGLTRSQIGAGSADARRVRPEGLQRDDVVRGASHP